MPIRLAAIRYEPLTKVMRAIDVAAAQEALRLLEVKTASR
jgi:hypothetical protein